MRPNTLHVGGTIYWVLQTRNPDTLVLKDADSTPSVAVRKNGASVGDSVTVTKRSATTGLYDCSYNPAGEVEGDKFTLEESATVTGTTTGSATYVNSFNVNVLAVERGTDSANTIAPATPTNVSDVQTAVLAKLPGALVSGRMDSAVESIAAGVVTSLVASIWNAATSGLSTAGSIGKRIVDYITGDIFARLGAPAGASIAADIAAAQTDLTTLLGRITAARAGYLDNLNVGGPVSSQADVLAINQSASRRVILTTLQQFERPESGSTPYTFEMRTYDEDGAAVNADSAPTITVTGTTTGSLAANVGTISNPATGLYRWIYSQQSNATLEPIRADVSPTLNGSQYPMSVHSQSLDFVAATWSTTDSSNLTTIFNKLPSRAYLAGASASTGAAVPADIGLASANLDTQLALKASQTSVDDLPTNAELTAALGTADDATLAAIAAARIVIDAILADTGTDGVVLSAATCAKIADVSRRRTQANVEASSDGDALSLGSEYGLIQQAQESNATATPGSLTVYKTDGSTVLGTKTLATDDTADPVVGVS